jgi:hypothetical protein
VNITGKYTILDVIVKLTYIFIILTFVKERPRPEIIFSVMYTILLPDDSLSNRLRPVIEI